MTLPRRPRRWVALDRDGTLIVDRPYANDPSGVELLPGAAAGLARLTQLGLGLVVITNQSAIGRGRATLSQVQAVHERLDALLLPRAVRIAGYYLCPHLPGVGCGCRKPAPGLLLRAASDHQFEPRRCFVVGDKPSDVELGRSVGATRFLIQNGLENGGLTPAVGAAHVAADLLEVAAVIEGLL